MIPRPAEGGRRSPVGSCRMSATIPRVRRWQREPPAALIVAVAAALVVAVAVVDYATAKKSDTAAYGRYFHGMLERGIYLAPSQFEAGFVSAAHTDADIDQTIAAAGRALARI